MYNIVLCTVKLVDIVVLSFLVLTLITFNYYQNQVFPESGPVHTVCVFPESGPVQTVCVLPESGPVHTVCVIFIFAFIAEIYARDLSVCLD